MNNNESNGSIDVKKSVNCEQNQCKQEINDKCIETNNQITEREINCTDNECNIEVKLKTNENLSFGKSLETNEEMVNNNKMFESNEMKDKETEDVMIYRRDSFDDRICDDLCSVVLKYLSFRDKIRLECVSKQFQSYVYINQKILSTQLTNDYDFNRLNRLYFRTKFLDFKMIVINVKALETLLIKCKAINSIEISKSTPNSNANTIMKKFKQIESRVIEVIIKYANNLKVFSCDFDAFPDHLVESFVAKFGQSLEKLFLHNSLNSARSNVKRKFIKMCPNLVTAETFSLSDFSYEYPKVNHLKRLTNLEFYFDRDDETLLLNFYLTYKTQLRHLRVLNHLGHHIRDNMPLNYLFRFKNLEILEFNYLNFRTSDALTKFELIGNECENIHKIIAHSAIVTQDFLNALSGFKNLKTLSLHDRTRDPIFNISCASLRPCFKLSKVYLHGIRFRTYFFNDIHLYLPNLISIEINNQLLENSILVLKSISSLSKLKKLIIIMLFEESIDMEINQLISNSRDLEIIQIDCLVNTTEESINKLISIALENPKISFEFNIDFEFNLRNLWKKIKSKPKNVLITQ